MNDWGKSVLGQYEMGFESVRRGKGVLLVESGGETFCLQPFRGSEKRVGEEAWLLGILAKKGHLVDEIVQTGEGTYIARNEYQDPFILKRWHGGEECASTDEGKLIRGARKLARLHIDMLNMPEMEVEKTTENELEESDAQDGRGTIDNEGTRVINDCLALFERHNRELRKVQTYLKRRKQKTSFEELVVNSLPTHMEQAERATKTLKASGYKELLEIAVEERHFTHGTYNYHYVYLLEGAEAVVNFSKYAIQVQILDLYEYIRKSLEKNDWSQSLGTKLIEAYNSIKSISDKEYQVLKALLLYPEKYWKQLNSYYNSNKAWIPQRSLEKLELAIRQGTIRDKFAEEI